MGKVVPGVVVSVVSVVSPVGPVAFQGACLGISNNLSMISEVA